MKFEDVAIGNLFTREEFLSHREAFSVLYLKLHNGRLRNVVNMHSMAMDSVPYGTKVGEVFAIKPELKHTK